MPAQFRKKLLDWLISMLLLCLCVAASLNAFWFFNGLTVWFVDQPLIFSYAGPIGEILFLYAAGFVPIAIWHCFDLLQRGNAAGRIARILSSSSMFHFVILMAGSMIVLSATGWFNYTAQCGSSLRIMIQDCYFTVAVLEVPRTLFLFSFLFLCICKGIITIQSLVFRSV